jgi:hypothetical protein
VLHNSLLASHSPVTREGQNTWTYDQRIKWDEATMLAIDSHKFSRKMRESIEIEKHNTIDQDGKPLDSTWRALFNVQN